jgi:hypothetical protein
MTVICAIPPTRSAPHTFNNTLSATPCRKLSSIANDMNEFLHHSYRLHKRPTSIPILDVRAPRDVVIQRLRVSRAVVLGHVNAQRGARATAVRYLLWRNHTYTHARTHGIHHVDTASVQNCAQGTAAACRYTSCASLQIAHVRAHARTQPLPRRARASGDCDRRFSTRNCASRTSRDRTHPFAHLSRR